MTDNETVTIYGRLLDTQTKTQGILWVPDLNLEVKFNRLSMSLSSLNRHVRDAFRKQAKANSYIVPPFRNIDNVHCLIYPKKEYTSIGILSFTFPKPKIVWTDSRVIQGFILADQRILYPLVDLNYPYHDNNISTTVNTIKEMLEARIRTKVEYGGINELFMKGPSGDFASPVIGYLNIPVEWPAIDWGDKPAIPDDDGDDDEEDDDDYYTPISKKKKSPPTPDC